MVSRDHAERSGGVVPGAVGEVGGPSSAEGVPDDAVAILLVEVGAGDYKGGAHLEVWTGVEVVQGRDHKESHIWKYGEM